MLDRRRLKDRDIRSDQLIRFIGTQAQKDCPCLLRRVVVWDTVNEREIVLLTNLLAFGATTVAAIYKDRWEIELFFKALKQNLKVKSFVGTSENALRIQIWTALIAILLLKRHELIKELLRQKEAAIKAFDEKLAKLGYDGEHAPKRSTR